MRHVILIAAALMPLSMASGGVVYLDAPKIARPASTVRHYADHYAGRHWTHPPDLYSHLRHDLVNHGYSEAELAGLTQAQLERLHDADHNGLVRPARKAAAAPIAPLVRFGFTFNSGCPNGRCGKP